MKISRLFLNFGLTMIAMSAYCDPQTSEPKNMASPLVPIDQAGLYYIASNLDVKYRVLSNIETDCPDKDDKEVKHCFSAYIDFTIPEDMPVNGWSIYFSQVYPVYASKSDFLSVDFYNGDIHQISPSDGFKGFKAGERQRVQLFIAATVLTHSQLMPNYWIAAGNLKPAVIESTRTQLDNETRLELTPWIAPYKDIEKQIKATPNDINKYADTNWLYEHNQDTPLDNSQVANTIIPTPKKIKVKPGGETIDLSIGINVSLSNILNTDVSAAFERLNKLGVAQSEYGVKLVISLDERLNDEESYTLNIDTSGIVIKAADAAGAFYGVQTLAALLSLNSLTVPFVTIEDAPLYGYRGQHIDVARNFLDKKMIFRLIEQMGAYKLNKLHMHLAEDEGWRISLPSFPELTEIGASRCMDLTDTVCMQPQLGSADSENRDGFYSEQDYKDILKYALRHHIQVIPSLDMPGHSRVALKAMEARYRRFMAQENEEEARRYLLSDLDDKTEYRSIQHYNDNTINVCLESSYAFVERVLEDLISLHKQANHPLTTYHIGADETTGAWVNSPECKALVENPDDDVTDYKQLGAHFIERVSNMIAAKGINVGGWNDGLGQTRKDKMPKNVYSYIWGPLTAGVHFISGAQAMTSEQAHRGWNVILSTPDVFYFDFPYEVDPKERGYNWASRRIDSRNVFNFMPNNLPINAEFKVDTQGHYFEIDDTLKKDEYGKIIHQPLPKGYKVTGIQGQVWSETIRSEDQAEYMLYPRMIALAERAWHNAKWSVPYNYDGAKYNKDTGIFTSELKEQRDQAWKVFANTLGHKELIKLDKLGVFYRLPTVGAKIIEGKLHINNSLPGLPLEYSVEGLNWKSYNKPVKVSGKVTVRARNAAGDRAGRSLLVKETMIN